MSLQPKSPSGHSGNQSAHCNDSLLEILHGLFLFCTPHKLNILLRQNDQWSCTFHKVLDPDPDNSTYTQESMNFSERGAGRPVQNLLNLLIFRVAALVSAFVTDSDHLRNAKDHLPTGKCPSSLFEPLENPIHLINMVTDKATNPRIFRSDLIKETIQTQCTW